MREEHAKNIYMDGALSYALIGYTVRVYNERTSIGNRVMAHASLLENNVYSPGTR